MLSMADHMDTSDDSSPSSQTALNSPINDYGVVTTFPKDDQDVTMKDVFQLTQELYCTKQELERARNDCHRLNHALTSMMGHFTKGGEQDTSMAVESAVATDKPFDVAQPLICFDDDDNPIHSQSGSTPWNNNNTLLDQSCSDLVSIYHTEPSAAWSSCATGRSSSASDSSSSCLPQGSQHGDCPEISDKAGANGGVSAVAHLENDVMNLALVPQDKEEGEIVERATKTQPETMPATFWKYTPDPPHPRNFLRLGINFNPEGQKGRLEARKTVLIQNLPAGIPLCRVLAHVRGRDVVKCTIVPAAGVAGWDAAYVHFKDGAAAAAYADFVRAHPLVLNHFRMIVEHLEAPSYPLPPHIHEAVYRYGATRCLRITCLAMPASQLYRALLHHFRTPLVIDGVHNIERSDVILARFASVEAAGAAWWLLKFSRHNVFGAAIRIEYAPDPCDAPLSTLLVKMQELENRHCEGTGRRYWTPRPLNEAIVLDY